MATLVLLCGLKGDRRVWTGGPSVARGTRCPHGSCMPALMPAKVPCFNGMPPEYHAEAVLHTPYGRAARRFKTA